VLREIGMGGTESGVAIYFASVHAPLPCRSLFGTLVNLYTLQLLFRRQKYRGTAVVLILTTSVYVLQSNSRNKCHLAAERLNYLKPLTGRHALGIRGCRSGRREIPEDRCPQYEKNRRQECLRRHWPNHHKFGPSAPLSPKSPLVMSNEGFL